MEELLAVSDIFGLYSIDTTSHTKLIHYKDAPCNGPQSISTVGRLSSQVAVAVRGKAMMALFTRGVGSATTRLALPEEMRSITFSVDGRICVGGGVSGTCYVWDLPSGKLLNCWSPHFKPITSLALSTDLTYLVTASEDSTCYVFSMTELCDVNE
eukprot:GHVN01039754.1.p1 GENE.GHVN01039754.1~~GHVN01039754.1.p1  ORF type:complete len:155 (+),score=43.16 GHVN01039754.1:87-551(+)